MQLNKGKIANNFSTAAATYDQYAVMQQQAVRLLLRRLVELSVEIAPGPILEIGCGTGALSRELVTLFPGRRLTLVDLAPGMIEKNRQALTKLLPKPHRVNWQLRDAETLDTSKYYALIASSLTLQWFQDLAGSLSRLCEALISGGFLLCSYLGDNSFPEWRQACLTLGVPCAINPLPNSHEVMKTVQAIGCTATTWEEMIKVTYPTAMDFFRSIKKTGACTSSAELKLTARQMSSLLSTLQGQNNDALTVTYHINTILVRA